MRVLFTVPGKQTSTNQAYRSGRGQFFMSREGKEFKDRISTLGKLAMGRRRAIQEDCIVVVDLYFKTKRNDLDGPLKLILDALQPWVIKNDRQVRAITMRKHHDAEIPRTLIEVATLEAFE